MSQAVNPTSLHAHSYRLSPYHFLADRKVWVIAGIMLSTMAFALTIHAIAVAVGFQTGSQAGYWLALIPLASVPIVLHIVAPRMNHRSSGRVLVAELRPGTGAWWCFPSEKAVRFSEIEGAFAEHALELCRHYRLDARNAPDVAALLEQLPEVERQVAAHVAAISGRALIGAKSPVIRVFVTDSVGSPYCFALAAGAMNIVIPLGALPAERTSPAAQASNSFMRYLLAHELSHILLRDEPISLFADARLVSIAAAVQSAAYSLLLSAGLALLLPLQPAAIGDSRHDGLVAAILLAVVVAVVPLVWPWLWEQAGALRFRRGHAWLATGGAVALLELFSALLLNSAGLAATQLAGAVGASWLLVTLTLFFAVLLSQLCIFLGRRQMEFLADENAINALAGREYARARAHMEVVLGAVAGAITNAGRPITPTPRYAIGHGSYPEQARSMTSRARRALGRWWTSGMAPLLTTHPELAERIAVVNKPDLQVEQDPSVPLVYAALPLVVFPYLARRLAGDRPTGGALLAAILIPPLLMFLALFVMIARRPTRRLKRAPDTKRSIHVGLLTLFYVSPAGTNEEREQADRWSIGDRLRTWWNAPLAGTAQPPLSPGQLQVPESLALGFLGEIGVVVRALLVATVLGMAVVGLVDWHVGRSTEGVSLPLLLLDLPPLSATGAILAITGLFLAWYIGSKFFSLAQWHHYGGAPLWANVVHQALNAVKALFLASFVAAPILLLAAVVRPTVKMLVPSAWIARSAAGARWLLAAEPLYGQVTAVLVGFLLLLATAYAAVVYWWPSLPQQVRCPLGHPVPLRWHNVLHRPDEEDPDWAWLRCPECGRSPQAQRLLCDADHEAHSFRKTATGWFVLVSLFGAAQLAFPIWMLGSNPATLDAIGRCRNLARFEVGEPGKSSFTDCTAKVGALPKAPASWVLLTREAQPAQLAEVRGDGRIIEVIGAMEETGSNEALLQFQMKFPWTCADWLTLVRNEVAYTETCMQTRPPKDEPVSVEQCQGIGEAFDISQACRCLWATGRDSEVRTSVRLVAAHRLFRTIHILLHDGAQSACQGKDEGRIWAGWHEYVEQGLTPRLFSALGRGADPDSLLGPSCAGGSAADKTVRCSAALPEMTSECRRKINEVFAKKVKADASLVEVSPQAAAGTSNAYRELIAKLLNDKTCAEIAALTQDESCRPEDKGEPAIVRSALCAHAARLLAEQCWRPISACLGGDNLARWTEDAVTVDALERALAEGLLHAAGERRNDLLPFAAALSVNQHYRGLSPRIGLMIAMLAQSGKEPDIRTRLDLLSRRNAEYQERLASEIVNVQGAIARGEAPQADQAPPAGERCPIAVGADQKSCVDSVSKLVSDTEVSNPLSLAFCTQLGQYSRGIGLRLAFDTEHAAKPEMLVKKQLSALVLQAIKEPSSGVALAKSFEDVALAAPRGSLRLCDWGSQWGAALRDAQHATVARPIRGALPARASGTAALEASVDDGEAPAGPSSVSADDTRVWKVLAMFVEIAHLKRTVAGGLPEYLGASFPMLKQSWGSDE